MAHSLFSAPGINLLPRSACTAEATPGPDSSRRVRLGLPRSSAFLTKAAQERREVERAAELLVSCGEMACEEFGFGNRDGRKGRGRERRVRGRYVGEEKEGLGEEMLVGRKWMPGGDTESEGEVGNRSENEDEIEGRVVDLDTHGMSVVDVDKSGDATEEEQDQHKQEEVSEPEIIAAQHRMKAAGTTKEIYNAKGEMLRAVNGKEIWVPVPAPILVSTRPGKLAPRDKRKGKDEEHKDIGKGKAKSKDQHPSSPSSSSSSSSSSMKMKMTTMTTTTTTIVSASSSAFAAASAPMTTSTVAASMPPKKRVHFTLNPPKKPRVRFLLPGSNGGAGAGAGTDAGQIQREEVEQRSVQAGGSGSGGKGLSAIEKGKKRAREEEEEHVEREVEEVVGRKTTKGGRVVKVPRRL